MKLISVLATHYRLYCVTKLRQTKGGDIYGPERRDVDAFAVANSVLPQMLQALDCIAWKGIVHRDVRPEKIFNIPQPNSQYQFQLGDFGLCNNCRYIYL